MESLSSSSSSEASSHNHHHCHSHEGHHHKLHHPHEHKHKEGHSNEEEKTGHHHHHHHHKFSDPEKVVAMLEGPERETEMRPAELIRFLHMNKSIIVCDIGAATGFFPVRFAPFVSHVFAVDLEKDVVAWLANRFIREGHFNATSILAKADDPLIPERVDLVTSISTYHHIENRVEYLRTLKQYLKADGRVAIIDFRKEDVPVKAPPMSMRLTAEETIREFEEAGYKLLERSDNLLPYHYVVVFGYEQPASQ